MSARRANQRGDLLRRYRSKIGPNAALDRAAVSFQGNRREPFYGWFKYREGFSSRLVEHAIGEFVNDRSAAAGRRATVLDPFAGVGTSLFVARSMGMDAIGIELMPVCSAVIEARIAADRVSPEALRRAVRCLERADLDRANLSLCDGASDAFPHIPITAGAFPRRTERAIAGFRAHCRKRVRDPAVRLILQCACLAVLESVSYTRKDGQYLRWDGRAERSRVGSSFRKSRILGFDSALRERLRLICDDIESRRLGGGATGRVGPRFDLRTGSCLDLLPQIPTGDVDLVVTSPPYCNRYDYTRTYALELAYCGLGADDVKALRQSLLSCTVENRTKQDELADRYGARRQAPVFRRVCRVFERQAALREVLDILERTALAGKLNNRNIPRMVRNYFFEMCLVISELGRIVRRGGRVVMVNDNVQYAAEEVPVDLILCEFARAFGFRIDAIRRLARGKGNSSQQMGRHGRSELRKCVYVWRKK